jgi:hypothetical protein
MTDTAYIYVRHTIPCPACEGPFHIDVHPEIFALLDAAGIGDDEVRERFEAHLLQRKIVCPECRGKGQG